MILTENRYGKQSIRILKVFRSIDRHSVKELTVGCLLHGDASGAHPGPDNPPVVPADTIKNTVHVLAVDALTENTEAFALHLSEHFLVKYAQISGVVVDVSERIWQRMAVDGQPHAHSFVDRGQGTPLVSLHRTRQGLTLSSGITGLVVMKTRESGFVGYPECDLTTFPETFDRIMATSIDARWTHTLPAEAGPALNGVVLATITRIFATEWSPSMQGMLYQMGEAVLQAVPHLSRIDFKLPNKHYLPIDGSHLGRGDDGVIFIPTDEPHGQVEATIRRGTPDTAA